MVNSCLDKELVECASLPISWDKIDNHSIMITGATGLCGTYFINVLLKRNEIYGTNTKIYAVGRDRKKFESRFQTELRNSNLIFIEWDVQQPKDCFRYKLDYVIHMASNTHPRAYAAEPISTEMTNILGTYNLLNMITKMNNCKFIFISSGDIYGDNNCNKEFLSEDDCGYINCNTLRAGYIEGKRASEALCNAFYEEKGIQFITARLCRLYGPTIQLSDSKAITQFIRNAINGEDIVLKSKGNQIFSYLYIQDAIIGMLYVIAEGKYGEAYNIADNKQCISLRRLAEMISEICGTKVVFDIQDEEEKKGASVFQDVRLDATKLYKLGWNSRIDMYKGLRDTIQVLK